MPQMIFVNLPVSDLGRSVAFYEAVGFTNNPQFTDDTAACMVLSDTICVMLLTHAKWAQFTSKAIADAAQVAQVLLCISREDRAAVDDIVKKAGEASGQPDPLPAQDFGFMYGHIWEPMWMDPATAGGGCSCGAMTPRFPSLHASSIPSCTSSRMPGISSTSASRCRPSGATPWWRKTT